MCFSARVSLVTFLIGIIFSYLLYQSTNPNYKIIGLFLGFVSLMQGIEFLLWIHPICDLWHKSFSILGMILNHLQPIILYFLIKYYHPSLSISSKNILFYLILLYTIIIIPYSLQYLTSSNLQCTITKCQNPHLIWNWNRMKYKEYVYVYFLICLVILSGLGMPNPNMGHLLAVLTLVTYFASYFIYDREAVGALWCFYAALLPMFFWLMKD